MKHQSIRLLDVFVIGPLMVYGGWKGDTLHPAVKIGLMGFGASTIIFNGMNWIRIRNRSKQQYRT